MGSVILGIPGLANKPEESLLTQWWETSIREGLEKNCQVTGVEFRFVMVYWSDLLYKNHQHQDPAFGFDSLYNDQSYVPATGGALKRNDHSWRDSVGAHSTEDSESPPDRVPVNVGKISKVDLLVDSKLKDMAFYYDEESQIRDGNGQMGHARRVLMDILMKTTLPLRGERVMFIAHSTGSLVAYDVLRDLGRRDREFPIHSFVTIGSPLGLFQVKSRVHSERIDYTEVPVRTPSVVTDGWVNYSDRRDPVAFDTRLADDYRPNGAGVRVSDALVLNDYVSPKWEPNCHKSYGYLRTPELSECIRNFLRV